MAAADVEHVRPPINFFYSHFHDSIRAELTVLDTSVSSLEPAGEQELLSRLQQLKERYHFLEQIYKYHSSVEDEVRGPQAGRPPGPAAPPPAAQGASEPLRAQPPVPAAAPLRVQVVYPALDAKVKNVTVAYTVEHQDEVRGRQRAPGGACPAAAPGCGPGPWQRSPPAPPVRRQIAAAPSLLPRRSCCSSSCRSC
jgi:hypothetical protein